MIYFKHRVLVKYTFGGVILEELDRKFENLKNELLAYKKLAIAFSGGVDSSFLLYTAHTLPLELLAVTATSASFPQRELTAAKAFTSQYGIQHVVIESEELELEGFSQNPLNRCYLCKHELFTKMIKTAKEHGMDVIAEASNADDVSDYRPGMQAIAELGVQSPLKAAGLTKEEIRVLSKQAGLDTWDKPSFACLASRFPYGQTITREKLAMVNSAEEYLLKLGYTQVRVRHHGEIARIEILPQEMERLLNKDAAAVYAYFKSLGFAYAALDIKGYRTGSMNETINTTNK
jgi:uncharacterized protein